MKAPPSDKTLFRRLNLIPDQLVQNHSGVLEGKDTEALHDFRVSLRRLRTRPRLLAGRYSSQKLKPVLVFLKGIAKGTDLLRDQEVLCSLWRSLPPVPKNGF